MKRLEIRSSTGNSQIIVDGQLKNLKNYLSNKKSVVITDKKVFQLHGNLFSNFEVIEIGVGEKIKTLNTVKKIYQKLLDLELDRSSFVIGIGGGIVCDITGFAASTFMRGIPFGFAPSTLLAQVDAGIGGKNGINFKGYKNIVGVFNQPQFVLLDFDLLKTLPEKERLCGTAEIVKNALIESASLFSYLEKKWQALLSLNTKVVKKAVVDSLLIKSKIVQADAKEKGERRKLNFGHTLGHALEKTGGFPHGKAISIGMVVASQISVARGLLSSIEAERIVQLLKNLELPTQIPSHKEPLFDAVKKDKKRHGEKIHFVLLREIGRAEVTQISYKELENHLNDLCKYR